MHLLRQVLLINKASRNSEFQSFLHIALILYLYRPELLKSHPPEFLPKPLLIARVYDWTKVSLSSHVSLQIQKAVLGRVDTKPNNASFRQNFTHPALKSLDRRQPACDFLPCLRKIYARKSAYYLSVNTP